VKHSLLTCLIVQSLASASHNAGKKRLMWEMLGLIAEVARAELRHLGRTEENAPQELALLERIRGIMAQYIPPWALE
jgi:hypothetical protein